MYKDLREFIAEVEKLGALRHVVDADPHIEIGGITEVAAGLPECPALLFDRIKGFPAGFRIVTNTGVEGGQEIHHLHIHVMGGPRPWLKG